MHDFLSQSMSLSAALEGKYASTIIDGNVDRDFVSTALRTIGDGSVAAVGVTVMGGPQLRSAIAVSKAIREKLPALPIIWGGAFPTVCPEATVNAPYVDYAVSAQGEDTLIELLGHARRSAATTALDSITGLSWRLDGNAVHNRDRKFSAVQPRAGCCLTSRLENPRQYLTKTYLGRTHDRLSGRLGLPVPLHLLRSRNDVSRQDGACPRPHGWSRTLDL